MRRPRAAALLLGATLVALPTAPATAGSPPTGDSRTVRASATQARVSSVVANTRITRVLRKRTTSKVLGSRFTMTVWDTTSSTYVYKRRAKASLRGASTTKVLTAVGVLAALGPDHRFPTTVRAGSAAGEVVLVAGGDPLLSSANLRALAASTVAALGAATPPGTTPPGTTPPGPTPTAAPSGSPTAPGPTPTADPTTAPGPAGPSAPTASPVSPGSPTGAATLGPIVVRADDSLFSSEGRSRGWKASWLPREVRPVRAFARDDNKASDATADAGRYFATALRALGVRAAYGGEATASPDAATLATYAGHSVAEAVSRMLLVSDNDTAEMLFRHVAVARGLPGSWAGARQALADTLRELRVPLAGVRIVDGSGLSLEGRLTAPALTSALNRALSPDQPGLAGLRGWLPVAGRTGTLKAGYKRFHARPARCAAGLIQAKTGTVADAIALAGYARGADGQTKIFVSIVNSRPTRYSRLTTRQYVDRAAATVTGCW